jgi:hypothetical protein
MSNRLHQKHHRLNHHSLRPDGNIDPKFPDTGYDPIASFSTPFQGEFYSFGDIITTKNLSAEKNILSNQHLIGKGNVEAGEDIIGGRDLEIKRDATILQNLTVTGNLSVYGELSHLETKMYVASAVTITNNGDCPALTVSQNGNYPIANFLDDNNSVLFVDGSKSQPGFVGLNTDKPTERLTVFGNISSNGSIKGHTLIADNKLIANNAVIKSLSSANSVLDDLFVNSMAVIKPAVLIFDTIQVPASSVVVLPTLGNDIELTATQNTTITQFISGVKGTLYTLTNKSNFVITLSSSSNMFIRNSTAVSFNGCVSWNGQLLDASLNGPSSSITLQLLSNHSCSLRSDGRNTVSIW